MEKSMVIRSRALPGGWFPDEPARVRKLVDEWTAGQPGGFARASVAPHAGWTFSGPLAARAVAALADCETVVVVAGHLGRGAPVLAAEEDGFETPLGVLEADRKLLENLYAELKEAGQPRPARDERADNGVEVLLPIVAALHPGAKVLWFCCPPSYAAQELGSALYRAAAGLGRSVTCVGSTDLTHYGPAYGFEPAGRGPKAEDWVRDVNDKSFVDALMAMDPGAALRSANERQSACSAGAAAAALGFAIESGATEARLLGRTTSLERRPDESFVGYCAVAWS